MAKQSKTNPAKVQDMKTIPVRTGEDDRQVLLAKAARYTDGNVSAFLRHAGRNYTPKPGERIELLPSYLLNKKRQA